MRCPRCDEGLKKKDLGPYGFVRLDMCPACEGTWFDKGELDRLDGSVLVDAEALDFSKVSGVHQTLSCPKCGERMTPLRPKDAKGLVVDRCPACEGFWLDRGEWGHIDELTHKEHGKLASRAVQGDRPADWSFLRWVVHRFKQCRSAES